MREKAISEQEALRASPRFEIVASVSDGQITYAIQLGEEDTQEELFTIDQALLVIEAKLEQGFAVDLEKQP